MSALKPCPFCGGPAQIVSGAQGCHYVRCEGCSATSDDRGRESAIEAWNRRPEPSAPSPAGVEVVAIGYASDYGLGKLASKAHHYCLSVNKALEKEFVNPIYGPESIATLTASLDRATRRAEEADQRKAAWDETRLANANLRNENGALRGRCSALEQALERLGSMEAFATARSVRLPDDNELIARIDFARESLSSTASSITEKETPDA